jgi:hypothetical protein
LELVLGFDRYTLVVVDIQDTQMVVVVVVVVGIDPPHIPTAAAVHTHHDHS